MTFLQRIASAFRSSNKDECVYALVRKKPFHQERNQTKVSMHQQTRASLREARRAIANAQAERYMRNAQEYEAWVLNAIDMLLEADACRECTRGVEWRN
jgi:hypothetical protein